MKILGFGPYIGNFEQEVLEFRPYIRWITEIASYDSLYLYTHKNRFFLYDWIPEENKIPVDEKFTLDEINYLDHRNRLVDRTAFMKMRGSLKAIIMKMVGCGKQEIDIHALNYSRSSIPCPSHNKIYLPIKLVAEKENFVFFIPSSNQTLNVIVQNYLESQFNLKICNMNINNPDRYRYNLKMMMSAKFVVCELSYWTFLCNQQKLPVFSWGEYVGPWKHGGMYNLKNNKSMAVSIKDSDESILKMIEYFILGLGV